MKTNRKTTDEEVTIRGDGNRKKTKQSPLQSYEETEETLALNACNCTLNTKKRVQGLGLHRYDLSVSISAQSFFHLILHCLKDPRRAH